MIFTVDQRIIVAVGVVLVCLVMIGVDAWYGRNPK